MVTQAEYREAQICPKLRQRFIDAIDLEDSVEFVKNVQYRDWTDRFGKLMRAPMRCTPSPLHFLGFQNTRANIIVYRIAFGYSEHPTVDDFLSSLIDHEGYHAKQFATLPITERINLLDVGQNIWALMNGSKKADKKTIRKVQILELEATDNQIRNFDRRNCSEKYIRHITGWHEYLTEKLAE